MSLSKDQLSEYEANGFIIVEGLLDAEEVAVLRKRADLVASGQLSTYPRSISRWNLEWSPARPRRRATPIPFGRWPTWPSSTRS